MVSTRTQLKMLAGSVVAGLVIGFVAYLFVRPSAAHKVAAPPRRPSLAGCTRSTLIRVEWLCGTYVVWVNPGGSRVRMKMDRTIVPFVHPEAVGP